MLRHARNLLRKTSSSTAASAASSPNFPKHSLLSENTFSKHHRQQQRLQQNWSRRYDYGSASSPSLSIWRRKKEMGKEGLIAAKELKRLQSQPVRLERFIRSHVSRLLKSDLVAVLAEFQRQGQVFLCMKVRHFFTDFVCVAVWLLRKCWKRINIHICKEWVCLGPQNVEENKISCFLGLDFVIPKFSFVF